jgi:hypothetical protein
LYALACALQELPCKVRRSALEVRIHAAGAQASSCHTAGSQAVVFQLVEQRTGTLRDARRCSIWRAHERRQHRAFNPIESRCALAEQAARSRIHAFQLAAERRQVQPRFEDLVLRPALLDGERLPHLPPLVDRVPPAAGVELRIEIGSELHGHRAAAAALAGNLLPDRGGNGRPVDAAMAAKTAVFGHDRELGQDRRDFAKRHPVAAPSLVVDAHARERLALAIEQPRVRRAPRFAHVGE